MLINWDVLVDETTGLTDLCNTGYNFVMYNSSLETGGERIAGCKVGAQWYRYHGVTEDTAVALCVRVIGCVGGRRIINCKSARYKKRAGQDRCS